MCKRNGTYGISHFTLMRFLFVKKCIKFAVSLLNWKRTNYLFSDLFYHTQQLSVSFEPPRSETAGTHPVAITIHHPGTAAIPSRNQGFTAGSGPPPPAKPGPKLTQQWVLSRVSMAGSRAGRTALLEGASSLRATLKM